MLYKGGVARTMASVAAQKPDVKWVAVPSFMTPLERMRPLKRSYLAC